MGLLIAREAAMLGLHGVRPVLLLTGAVVILLGLATLGGGIWLVAIGGSPYYLVAGLGLILSGAVLLARRAAALWVYALIVLGTLGWSVAESGLRWWPLAARGDVVFLVGLWLLLPWIAGRL